MSDRTHQSDPVPAPPERSCEAAAPSRSLRRRLFQLGAAGACAALAAALTPSGAHTTAVPAAKAEVHDGALRTDGDAIVLTPDVAARLGLIVTVAREAALAPLVTTTGTVTFDPHYTAAVGTRLPGIVQSVSRVEGDVVRAGESLAVLEGAELGMAQADILSLRAHEHAAETSFDRETGLGARGLSSMKRMEGAAARYSMQKARRIAAEQRVAALGGASAPSRLGVHRLTSPLAGTIVERHVNAGQSVEGHRVAFRVANLDHLWVELSVVESHVRGVRVSDPVEICASSIPDGEGSHCVKGAVAHVGEQVDPANLAVTVRIEVDNSARKLRAGQAVSAKIRPSGSRSDDGVVVPRSAVVRVDGQPLVFVQAEDGRLVPAKVELAESNESEQRVLSGVAPGQKVVSGGAPGIVRALFR